MGEGGAEAKGAVGKRELGRRERLERVAERGSYGATAYGEEGGVRLGDGRLQTRFLRSAPLRFAACPVQVRLRPAVCARYVRSTQTQTQTQKRNVQELDLHVLSIHTSQAHPEVGD